ncbi:Lysophospholipase L1 [Litoreibacter ascidiaceicola]|uniref:Lysophospholipase L1 n=1 Tax=Litoreibacter ascidiaceicola TaxID=1486859 RepID=A0A1M4VML4_9RHOB|nr:SGNH/GDSL hydrolase family protein [Litoreibacter ascidiaceicola]SHE70296.1 Lysophospholipase L1 [Litoreibacter ascidiaceicola]
MISKIRDLFLAACAAVSVLLPAEADAKDDILVIGDSMLEWQSFKGASIPQVLAKRTKRNVENRAASGAKLFLTGAEGNARSVIPTQYTKGNWNWVVVNGGANDLLAKCGCSRCDSVLDKLISEDASSGVLPDLAKQIRDDGPRVILLAYYEGNVRPNLFSRCEKVVKELTKRQRRLASRLRGVELVRTKAAIDPKNRSHFALDGFHLSRKGTRRVGALLAQTLVQLEARRP